MKLASFLVLVMFVVPAWAEGDPFENANRKVHGFNDVADRKIFRPVASGYRKVLPEKVRFSVGNFFDNLADVGDGVNNLLQFKPGAAFSDLGRVLINSTIGLGGLFDPASRMGLTDHQEDFSQTLAVWGVPKGPFLVVPFMGPSTARDAVGRFVNGALDPLRYYYPVSHRNSLIGVRAVDVRAGLLTAESVVFGDRYIFYRDAYLQRREYLENDGQVEDPFGDDF